MYYYNNNNNFLTQPPGVSMGNVPCAFTEHELEDYQELTYLTKKEIEHLHKRFRQLAPAKVKENRHAKIPKTVIMAMPELSVNPFRERICDVFSSSQDGTLCFEDFLDMASVFCDACPKNLKVEYAFRIYDFDNDDVINIQDLKNIINRLTGVQRLCDADMTQLIQNILQEADLDDDNSLSFSEFEHIITKAPDFVNTFRIRF